VWLYAQAFAHANTGDLKAAMADRDRLAAMTKLDYASYEGAGIPAKAVVELSLALADGEISRKSGVLDGAIVSFRYAAKLEHDLPYTEPPWWHQPTSHLLGAALLEAGRAPEAEAVYRESLKGYRRDGWALAGLAQAQAAQGKTAEAVATRRAFDDAWKLSDVKLTASRL
jgi:tetratricopeptide (TPR) repeat protein